jgi:ribulose-phosphate 3-epimerase
MIIPAILENTIEGFNEKIEKLSMLKKLGRIQVDFCDGVFVGKKTVAAGELAGLDKKIEWEAHVMAKNPSSFEEYQSAGFSMVIIHYEAFESEHLLDDALSSISKLGMTPALAINPETTVSVLRYFTDNVSNFTLMSVHPGKQGQAFLKHTLNRVKELREMAPDATIEVDGGINSEHAASIIEAGANHLAVGSALFETEDIKENYAKIASALKK